MNFLAHIYLSGDDCQVQIGNFMADGIRGKDFLLFPEKVQRGIILHRAIDTFTDAHPLFRQGTKRLHQKYHHYAGVVMDVFYDHFLAANWREYHAATLEDFSRSFYQCLDDHYDLLTIKTQNMLPVMKRENWLLSYRTADGIEKILCQMDYRTNNRSKMGEAKAELLEHYEVLKQEFAEFFEEVKEMAASHLLLSASQNKI